MAFAMTNTPPFEYTMLSGTNLTPIRRRRYAFTAVKEFIDLEALQGERRESLINNPDPAIAKTANDLPVGDAYLRPMIPKDRDDPPLALENLIEANGGSEECRVIFVSRHGQTKHNVSGARYGRGVSFAVRSHFDGKKDPKLTDEGHEQAGKAGYMICRSDIPVEFCRNPTMVACSSLKRCVQTAVAATWSYNYRDSDSGDKIRQDPRLEKDIRVFASDGWREWTGPDQNHVSDKRGPKGELAAVAAAAAPEHQSAGNRKVEVDLGRLGPDTDANFYGLGETFVNIDIRFEEELQHLFEKPHDCYHIVSHGRAIHSLLRLLGFQTEDVEKRKQFRVWDFDNCATVAVLVRRRRRTAQEIDELVEHDKKLQMEEKRFIDNQYEGDIRDGFEEIQKLVRSSPEKRAEYEEMARQLEDECEEHPEHTWRLKLLREALADRFERRLFKVEHVEV